MRARPVRLALLLLLAWLSATGAFGTCDLFRPATPEAPVGSGSVVHEVFTTPESTLATMSRAITARVAGKTAYMDCLVDPSKDRRTFYAVMDPSVEKVMGRSPMAWNNDDEGIFFDQFVNHQAGVDSMVWSKVPSDPDSDYFGGSTQLLRRHYEVFNTQPQANGLPPIVRRYATGKAYLSFVLSTATGRWVLQGWTDFVNDTIGPTPTDGRSYSISFYRLSAVPG